MNEKIIIGSTAIKHCFGEAPREPKDLDYAVEVGDKSYNGIEYLSNPILFKYLDYMLVTPDDHIYIASPNVLYTLKMSHMFWDINWNKHLYDIQWLKERGCKVIKSLFYELYNYWNEYHSKNKRSDLKMTSEDFFTNAVKCEYDHDYLHTLLVNPPTFTKILVGEVEVSEDKFNNLSYEEKCSLVREEVWIMSFERFFKIGYKHAYSLMLKKFIISHAPLWEAIFILDNYKDLYHPKIDYITELNNKLDAVRC